MLQATHDSRHLMLIDAAGDPRQWTYLRNLKKIPGSNGTCRLGMSLQISLFVLHGRNCVAKWTRWWWVLILVHGTFDLLVLCGIAAEVKLLVSGNNRSKFRRSVASSGFTPACIQAEDCNPCKLAARRASSDLAVSLRQGSQAPVPARLENHQSTLWRTLLAPRQP